MFIRIFKEKQQREILINVDHISRIEVGYVAPSGGDWWRTSLKQGHDDPATVRIYKFTVAGDEYQMAANPDDPVMQIFEKIYNDAVKG